MAAYEAAMSGPRTAIGAGRVKPGSVAAVVAEYLDSRQAFGSKSAGTQRMRRGILERFRAAYGDRPMALLPAEWIEALLDSKPPHAARSWRATLRSLCQFAVRRRYRRDDPTANIKLRPIKGDGFHTWTDDEIAQFEAHHPVGTKPRLALALLLYTTQRRGDVIRMGRQHIRETAEGPALYVKQRKTGRELLIPIYPELRAVLDASRSSPPNGHPAPPSVGCWIFAGRAARSRSNNLVISTTEQHAALPYQGSARRRPASRLC